MNILVNTISEYTVWVGGSEVTDCYVDKETAERIKEIYEEDGYTDVVIDWVD